MWKKEDELKNGLAANNISIIESRAGKGAFYVFEKSGNEMVSARGTIGWFGKHEGNIDINFYIPEGKTSTKSTKRRLFLTKECAKIPSKEREKIYLQNIVCTDPSGCNFRRN
ncbi:hypothetical protein Xmau_03012 [Xenorhabdus mauleonii]|uniref:Uncharacterized protein n=1 Tax=Xenorhabdus mauleonii TaxID=351675 RepID=A0A1I3SD46_9GAMM|nr:hypothetical protein [Xenorhabdus mauleonii]PHM39107.1 hypothetical protein Xmau_03012 [Xenorhabdus mauleonii]SFJ55529.1 hypothetical protein SAMN05421680_11133 [Xenorhabdus mauleonii]